MRTFSPTITISVWAGTICNDVASVQMYLREPEVARTLEKAMQVYISADLNAWWNWCSCFEVHASNLSASCTPDQDFATLELSESFPGGCSPRVMTAGLVMELACNLSVGLALLVYFCALIFRHLGLITQDTNFTSVVLNWHEPRLVGEKNNRLWACRLG